MEFLSTAKRKASTECKTSKKTKKSPRKIFDFSRYNQRRVAFKLAYLGWDYHGLASQDGIEKTIEAELFNAFTKTCLVENRASSNYTRSGRTDKGVSALGQVISLNVRTNLVNGPGIIVSKCVNSASKQSEDISELQYIKMLNKVLPDDIRILAWTPVDCDFSARFNTVSRTYKYYFPRGNMNIKAMDEAAQRLKGEHDFRNFCKMDLANVSNFRREILSIKVQNIETSNQGFEMCEIIVCGTAFLWHQIIDYMLDITKCTKKPQYGMASEFPLVLFDCAYKDLTWMYDEYAHNLTVKHFKKLWAEHAIKTTLIKQMLSEICIAPSDSPENKNMDSTQIRYDQPGFLTPGHYDQVSTFRPIRTRPTCGLAPAPSVSPKDN